jgi:hypothetical protein
MKASLQLKGALILVWCAILALGVASQALAGAGGYSVKTQAYEGQIQSVKIEKCGLQPGSCEGTVVLTQPNNERVTLAIRSGTWIKRGDSLVTIDELGVGNYVKAEAVQIPGEQLQRITILSTGGD